MPIVLILAIGFVIVATVVIILVLTMRRPRIESLSLRLLHITVPQNQEKKDGDIKKEINFSEQLLNSLRSLNQPFALEAAVHHSGATMHFYAAVPRDKTEFVSRQIQGLFTDARVEETDDYNIFSPSGGATGAYLALAESPLLPIRTYEESGVDTFAQTLSNMSKLADIGEGAAVQIMVRPASSHYIKNATTAITKLKQGEKLKDLLNMSLISFKDFKDLNPLASPAKKDDKPKIIDDEAVKVLQSKISKPLFLVSVRLVASGETKERAEDILMSLAGAYAQFSGPLRNDIKVIKPRNLKDLFYGFSFREFDLEHSMVLNASELASIFHLPTFATDVPRISWLTTKEAPPPENLPEEGVIVGKSVFRGDERLVRMTVEDRRRHLYIIGQTGTGKSGLMQNMIDQDIKNGAGVCVIDPHGDLVNHVLERVPASRIDDVIVFDPGDIERPLGLNMLEYDFNRPEQKSFIVDEMQSIFNQLYKDSPEGLGPVFQQYMRNTLLLLMEDAKNEPATLVEVPRVFTDAVYRERKLARINNPTVIDFWQKEATKTTGEGSLANMAPYITTKFGAFINNDYVRPIIGQPKSAFDFRQIMDNKKILLVNLSKGKIGDLNSNLLGMVITGRILMAALSRADMDEASRKDFYFYIDEFQNYTTDSINVILSEARKYRLNLHLAHQFISQLKDSIREAVFGNVGSMAAFRVGVSDTETLVKQFGPEFNDKDLLSVQNRQAFVRLLIKGYPTRPFNIKTLDFSPGSKEVRDKLRELSRLKFGRLNSEVENEIFLRLRN